MDKVAYLEKIASGLSRSYGVYKAWDQNFDLVAILVIKNPPGFRLGRLIPVTWRPRERRFERVLTPQEA